MAQRKTKRNLISTNGTSGRTPNRVFNIEATHFSEFRKQGEVTATEVHMLIHLKNMEAPLCMRFKSPDSLGDFIEIANAYRNRLWPDAEPLNMERTVTDE